jgi:hypothetical protein
MPMRASCGSVFPGVKHVRRAARTVGPQKSTFRRDVSLMCAQVTSAFDWAIMRMYEYCRAVVAREKLGVIRSGKVTMLVNTGSPLSGWTERVWRGAGSAG